MSKKPPSIGMFLLVLVAFEVVLVGLVVLTIQYMPAWQGPAISVITVLGIALIARAAFRLLWNRMLAPWPPLEIPSQAARRSFQSFSFGNVNMAFSINAAVDDTHLHLEPILPWRALGAHSASIPFSAMTPSGRGRTVRIGDHTVWGPKWCLKNAMAD